MDKEDRDQLDVLNARIAVNVLPLLKDINHRTETFYVLAWLQVVLTGVGLCVIGLIVGLNF